MNALIILNDPAYGTERTYNGLRLANALARSGDDHVRVFLIGDGVTAAMGGQNTPNGYYNLGTMIKALVRRGGEVATCGTCIDARGIAEGSLVEGAARGSMDQLAAWTREADKVIVF